MASPNDIKKGTVININGELYIVTDFQRVSPGKGSSFVRTRVRNFKTGKVVDQVFKSAETLTFEDVSYKKMQFLFTDGSMYTFMDTVTYDQITLGAGEVGNDAKYLKEGLEVSVVMHGASPLAIELPRKISYVIAQTEPAVKGDTASGNVLKDAEAENGLALRVPIFINQGDEVVINTDDGSYVERLNK